MKISVVGCGRWGSFIGWYLVNNGHSVIQWGTPGHYTFDVLKNTGKNEYVELDERIEEIKKAHPFPERKKNKKDDDSKKSGKGKKSRKERGRKKKRNKRKLRKGEYTY